MCAVICAGLHSLFNHHDFMSITEQQILDALKTVKDPELDIDIVSLGLIRSVSIDDMKKTGVSGAEIIMTLTSPLCPFAGMMIESVEDATRGLGLEDVRVELSFDPPWEVPEELRAALGI
jgi:metal-sulfur cluster biosynthetic enzyme